MSEPIVCIDLLLLAATAEAARDMHARLARALRKHSAIIGSTPTPPDGPCTYIELSEYRPTESATENPGFGAALRYLRASPPDEPGDSLGRELVELIDTVREEQPCLALDFITDLAAPAGEPLPLASLREGPTGYETRGLIKIGLPELIAERQWLELAGTWAANPHWIEATVAKLIENPCLATAGTIDTAAARVRIEAAKGVLRLRPQATLTPHREGYFHAEPA